MGTQRWRSTIRAQPGRMLLETLATKSFCEGLHALTGGRASCRVTFGSPAHVLHLDVDFGRPADWSASPADVAELVDADDRAVAAMFAAFYQRVRMVSFAIAAVRLSVRRSSRVVASRFVCVPRISPTQQSCRPPTAGGLRRMASR